MRATGQPKGGLAIRRSIVTILLGLVSAGCGRSGLGVLTDAAPQDQRAPSTEVRPEAPSEVAPETARDARSEDTLDARFADVADAGNTPAADARDGAVDRIRADGTADARQDRLAEAGSVHCTPGLISLGGLPVPRIPGPPSAIAVGDLDGDGHADLAMTEGGLDAVAVLLGRGDGTFAVSTSFATGRGPAGVAIADVDGDGRADLMVANTMDDTVSVLLGTGNGDFAAKADYPAESAPSTMAVGDFTGDGHPDIAVASSTVSSTGQVTVERNLGKGTFSLLTAYPSNVPNQLAMGDLDGDGRADLAVAGWPEAALTLFFGGANGAVGTRAIDEATPASKVANGVVMGDLNGDGRLDVAWSTGDALHVALNRGGAMFAPTVDYGAGPVMGCPSYGLSLGDVNADGRPDLIALNDDCANVTVLLNRGDGGFAESAVFELDGYPYPMATGDLNGDQRADLVLDLYARYLTILLARPDGSFTPAWLPAWDTVGETDGAIGDLDGDGNLDLVRTEEGNTVAVWLGRADGTLTAGSRIPFTATLQTFGILDANGDGILDVASWGGAEVSILLGRGRGDLGGAVITGLDGTLRSAAFGDLDGDGDADLVAGFFNASEASVLLSRGDGSFGAPKQYAAGRFANVGIGDLNGDGKRDLVFTSAADRTMSLWFGRGDGTFDVGVEVTVTGSPDSPFFADINGDGITDLIVTSHSPDYHIGVLLGRKGSPGVLRDVAVDFPPDTLLGIGDMDQDGYTDLVFRSGSMLFVLRGGGDDRFVETLAYQDLRGSPMALVDFDDDGRPDVVVAAGDAPRWHVYRNDLCQ